MKRIYKRVLTENFKHALNDISMVYLFLNSGVLQWEMYCKNAWTCSYGAMLSQDKHEYKGKRYYSEHPYHSVEVFFNGGKDREREGKWYFLLFIWIERFSWENLHYISLTMKTIEFPTKDPRET